MVASVGIAATAFLLLQPALASNNDIFARQLPSNFDPTKFLTCQTCLGLASTFAGNSSCASDSKCSCAQSVVEGVKSCINCAVNASSISSDDANTLLKEYQSACAQGGVTVTGLTTFSATASGTGSAATATASQNSGAFASNMPVITIFSVLITAVLGAITPL